MGFCEAAAVTTTTKTPACLWMRVLLRSVLAAPGAGAAQPCRGQEGGDTRLGRPCYRRSSAHVAWQQHRAGECASSAARGNWNTKGLKDSFEVNLPAGPMARNKAHISAGPTRAFHNYLRIFSPISTTKKCSETRLCVISIKQPVAPEGGNAQCKVLGCRTSSLQSPRVAAPLPFQGREMPGLVWFPWVWCL